jgi:hypothetical protein
MKNKNLISILFLLIVNLCWAQDKGFVAVSIGPSIPIEDFASKNSSNVAAGYANPGAIFDVSFQYKLGKYFGISALLRGQANTTDAQAIANELAREINNVTWIVESNPWSIGGILIGGTASVPIGLKDKVSFESRAMFGFLNAASPEINITGRIDSQSEWAQQHSKMSTAFSYLLGAGFKFNIAKRLCVLTNIDFLSAKPEFKDVLITNSKGDYITNTFSQKFGTINIGFGIGLRLNKIS